MTLRGERSRRATKRAALLVAAVVVGAVVLAAPALQSPEVVDDGSAGVPPAEDETARGDRSQDHDWAPDDPRGRPAVPPAPRLPRAYRFISAPDFLNQDVADLTARGGRPVLDPTSGRVATSTSASYEDALLEMLDEMRSQGARDVLVAGDLVEGRWGRDDSGTGVFGPIDTPSQRFNAARAAADVYYRSWARRLARHGLTPFPALGDHEIGDNPWARRGDEWIDFKLDHVDELKKLYSDHVLRTRAGAWRWPDRPSSGQARRTAYATRLDPNVLLVTIDPFTRSQDDVRMRVDAAQLRWLRQVLRGAREARVPWVVVQGHTPITGPVRHRNSSRLRYERGTSSPLWKAMVDGGVDVYLCGEVHDQSVNIRDGIMQVAHGSLFYRGEASYILGQATRRQLVLENHQFRGQMDFTDRLWTTSRLGAPAAVSYRFPSIVTGTLSARRTPDGGLAVQRTAGILDPVG